MQRLTIILVSVALVLTVGVGGCAKPAPAPALEEPIELGFADWIATVSWWQTQFSDWLKVLEERSNGRIKTTNYPGASLLGGGDIYTGVGEGIADMGKDSTMFLKGAAPLTEVLDSPGLDFHSAKVVNCAKWETVKALRPLFDKEYEEDGLHLVFMSSHVPLGLASREPIRTLEDIKGKRIWVPVTLGPHITALGAVPVQLTYGEAYDAFAKGAIFAALIPPALLETRKLAEVTKAITVTGFMGTATSPVVMNLEKWRALPEDIQKIISETDEWMLERQNHDYDAYNTRAVVEFAPTVTPGYEAIYLSDEEAERWLDILRPIIENELEEREAKGVPARKVYAEFTKQVEKFNNIYPRIRYGG